jgi:hypothetical protein
MVERNEATMGTIQEAIAQYDEKHTVARQLTIPEGLGIGGGTRKEKSSAACRRSLRPPMIADRSRPSRLRLLRRSGSRLRPCKEIPPNASQSLKSLRFFVSFRA